MSKPSEQKNSSDTIWLIAKGGGVHTLEKGMSPKMKLIALREFELTYYDVVVQHVGHYTTETPMTASEINWTLEQWRKESVDRMDEMWWQGWKV